MTLLLFFGNAKVRKGLEIQNIVAKEGQSPCFWLLFTSPKSDSI
jgi:hypothetical protein